ncbi:MAG: ATP-binding protein [Bacilli bacterium]|nr:ATP-binding protein [Bacilli bacterium]
MLLEFKTKNYKSFLDEMKFSMIPAPKQSGLDYSVFEKKIGKKTYKGLSSAVIYGANASGKTNIISAMETFKNIILKGNINSEESMILNNTIKYELIPNNQLKVAEPTHFSIKFITDNLLIEYEVSLDLGTFLNANYNRKILSESLSLNETLIYERNDTIHFSDHKAIKKYIANNFELNIDSAQKIAQNNLNETELFLTNGFKNIFSSQLVNKIVDWIRNDFLVICRADLLEINKSALDSKPNTVYIEKTTNEAAKLFGINSNALGYIMPKDGSDTQLYSIFSELNAAIPARLFESYGTVRFINTFPLIIQAILNGSVLVLDEFDANIHPMALISIINLFHNDDINISHAQLIFNTHNPIFLNSNVFRRDEIKFVERDEETHLSSHYSLSDFKTSGKNGVRKTSDYMSNYFIGKYGAIKDIDFSELFEELINE